MPRTMTVDKKSWELAEHFLEGGPYNDETRTRILAEVIQKAVEDEIGAWDAEEERERLAREGRDI